MNYCIKEFTLPPRKDWAILNCFNNFNTFPRSKDAAVINGLPMSEVNERSGLLI